MKYEIKNRLNGSLIFSVEANSWRIAVELAIKAKTNLSFANLRSANLSFANLRSANLSFANLRSANLSSADLGSADLSFADLRSANLSSADLSYANLRFANLSSADLSYANLRFANLSSADLRFANLSSADLSFADLSSANLSFAKTDKTYYQISCIGSRKGMTTYCVEDDKIWCGCWSGTLKEFIGRVKGTHKNNAQYLAEYKAAITFFKAMTKMAKGRK